MGPWRCTEVPKRLLPSRKRNHASATSLFTVRCFNAILFRIFENDQQSGFRFDGFSRLTHFQSGITNCLLSTLFHFISHLSKSRGCITPHPLVVVWGNLSVSLGIYSCHMLNLSSLYIFVSGAGLYATGCRYGATTALIYWFMIYNAIYLIQFAFCFSIKISLPAHIQGRMWPVRSSSNLWSHHVQISTCSRRDLYCIG